ncbi:MAG TPA: hypothetical protein ENK73_04445, partial [Thiomicrospira sp.]|nr:hypothetical protein [Thiomicrospira sp.]
MSMLIADKIESLQNSSLSGTKGLLFALISITFVLYIYRNVIVVNAEFVLVLILLISSYVVYRIKHKMPKAIWVWTGLLVLYWLTTFVATFVHDSPEKRALTVLSVASLSWVFIILTMATYKLKPGLDFFWYLMLVGGTVALSLGVLDAYEYGWFHSGMDHLRLGQ